MQKSLNRKVGKVYRKDRKELASQGFKVIDFAYFAHSWRFLRPEKGLEQL
jgi:hypothetical protein